MFEESTTDVMGVIDIIFTGETKNLIKDLIEYIGVLTDYGEFEYYFSEVAEDYVGEYGDVDIAKMGMMDTVLNYSTAYINSKGVIVKPNLRLNHGLMKLFSVEDGNIDVLMYEILDVLSVDEDDDYIKLGNALYLINFYNAVDIYEDVLYIPPSLILDISAGIEEGATSGEEDHLELYEYIQLLTKVDVRLLTTTVAIKATLTDNYDLQEATNVLLRLLNKTKLSEERLALELTAMVLLDSKDYGVIIENIVTYHKEYNYDEVKILNEVKRYLKIAGVEDDDS